jgi:hypothetical protein
VGIICFPTPSFLKVIKKKRNTKPTLILIGIAIVVIFGIIVAQPILTWIAENKEIIIASLIALVLVTVALLVWWWYERIKKQNEAFYRLVDAIKSLNYIPTFREERPYHSMIYGYLIGKGFEVKWEVGTGASRPDLVVEGIAIEVKGPTDSMAMQTLSHKIMKYSNHYHYLIIVLFDCMCSKYTLDETLMGIAKMVKGRMKLEVIVKRAT